MESAAEPPLREFIAGPEYLERAQRAWVRHSFTQRPIVLVLALIGGIALLSLILGFAGSTRFFDTALAAVILLAAAPLMLVAIGRRRVRQIFLPNSRYAVSLRPEAMHLETAFATSEIRYAAYLGVSVRDSFVFLHHRGGPVFTALPIELFPPEELAKLTALIAKANA